MVGKPIRMGFGQAQNILREMLDLGFEATVRPIRGLAGNVVDVYFEFTPPSDLVVEGPYFRTLDGETRGRGYRIDLSPGSLYLIIPSRGDFPAVLKRTRPEWIPQP